MKNIKRKLVDSGDVISCDLKKKIKTSYAEVDDSNALILPQSNKSKDANKTKKAAPELLSKKKRKELAKKLKSKDDKLIINDIHAELKLFNEMRPEEATKLLSEQVKTNLVKDRTTLSTKVKPVSKRKYKRWESQLIRPAAENNVPSPDTSDFSSDDENLQDIVEPIINSAVLKEDKIESSKMIDTAEKVVILPEIKTELPKAIPHKSTPKTYVTVDRPKSIQAARLELPILSEEATVMEAINENDIVILSGATGCGKTTQMPQFLYEAGFTQKGYKIGVTEPRRIAAISVSERVKYELAAQNSNLVGYQVRYQNMSNVGTQIKFMTDGILLQEITKQDIMAKSYSAIIIDEAHERSVYTDILIGLLSIIVRARRKSYEKACLTPPADGILPLPLKLIIMSATLRVSDFAENKRLFPGEKRPPVIQLDSRQFPVQVTFSKHTRSNYLEEAFKTIYKVHNESTEGGILVFVTGQQDCLMLCKWLKKAFPVTQKFLTQMEKEPVVERMSTNKALKKLHENQNQNEPEFIKVNLTDFSIIPIDEEAELNVDEPKDEKMEKDDGDEYESDEDEYFNFHNIINDQHINNNCINPVFAVPLYSLLDKEKQDLVFQPPPPGQRLVVIATNVAETSLTIPNIKYVIDTGMEKVKKWDKITGMSKFKLERISKSSAEQRKGRAGRTAPGHCFRLYSSAVYEEMKPFSLPEIVQRPVEDVVLLLRKYIHSSIPIHDFCLPTVPSKEAIDKAEKMLVSLGALKNVKVASKNLLEITEMGKSMSQVPLSSRFARMLLLSNQHNLLPYAVLLASLLSVQDFFANNVSILTSDDTKEENILAVNFKRESIKKRSDLMFGDITVLLASFCKLENVALRSEDEAKKTAEMCGVRWKAFCEVKKLRQQLTDILTTNVKDLDLAVSVLPRPTNVQFEHLRQLLLSGSPHNVAVIAPPNIKVGQTPNERRKEKGMYISSSFEKPVYIYPQSVLCREKFQWIVYQDVYENVVYGDNAAKPFMRNISVIEPEWLPLFCSLNCHVEGLYLDNKQCAENKPIYDEKHDRIMSFAKKIFYGDRRIELPSGIRVPVIYEIMENEEIQGNLFRRWFARFFLEGVIFKGMESWKSKLKSTCNPELLLAPFANSRPEILSLMNEISKLKFPSKKAICDMWKDDSKYLLNAYLDWVKPDDRESVISLWPPVEAERN